MVLSTKLRPQWTHGGSSQGARERDVKRQGFEAEHNKGD